MLDDIIDLRCPKCGDKHNRVTHLGDFESAIGLEPQPPKPGDLNICLNCGGFGRYGEELEIVQFAGDLNDFTPKQRAKIKKAQKLIGKRGRLRVNQH